MPKSARRIVPADIVPATEYARARMERRRALIPMKKKRRVEVGPYATISFESYDTMLLQVQEMLYIEKGGPEQVADELSAYNPMIPQGQDLRATLMMEIDEPVRRANILRRLTGIEERCFLQVGPSKIYASPEQDVERTASDGKTSAVHFLMFPFQPAEIAAFQDPAVTVMLGFDHEQYGHLAVLTPACRSELASDFA